MTTRAVIARINRKRKPDDEMVKVTRSDRWRHELTRIRLGVDVLVYNPIAVEVEDVEVAELGVLGEWEEVRDE